MSRKRVSRLLLATPPSLQQQRSRSSASHVRGLHRRHTGAARLNAPGLHAQAAPATTTDACGLPRRRTRRPVQGDPGVQRGAGCPALLGDVLHHPGVITVRMLTSRRLAPRSRFASWPAAVLQPHALPPAHRPGHLRPAVRHPTGTGSAVRVRVHDENWLCHLSAGTVAMPTPADTNAASSSSPGRTQLAPDYTRSHGAAPDVLQKIARPAMTAERPATATRTATPSSSTPRSSAG